MEDEQYYAVKEFIKNFSHLKNSPIALYGIGPNSKAIIEQCSDFNIIGLLDASREGDTLFGKTILTIEEAFNIGIKAVIIIARISNVPLIYRRIEKFCQEMSIDVYDLNGSPLEASNVIKKDFSKYKSISESNLKAKIYNADIVSFDIFDTLLMRRCLYPKDVFELIGDDFLKRRVDAEVELSAEKQPNIYDIYDQLKLEDKPEYELLIEHELLIPRYKIAEMVTYAIQLDKSVWLTSDMYLTKEMILSILSKWNIKIESAHIIVSCEWGVSKKNGLFNKLRELAGEGRILHIGDNYESDVMSAKRYGIDDVFQIESAVSMLSDSHASELLNYDNSLSNRLAIGGFIAKELNDPFLFSETNGKFRISSNYDFAYSYVAPLLVRFYIWMSEKACELELDEILLGSRDGYIISKMHEVLKNKVNSPQMKYLYVSRAVATIAGIRSVEDIIHVARLNYSNTPKSMLSFRFHLSDDEIKEKKDCEGDEEYILRHTNEILRVASEVRKKYLKYIDSLEIDKSAKVGFFDFFSSGTCQKGLANVVPFELYGLYFIRALREKDYMPNTEIFAMFGALNGFEKNFYTAKEYVMLENILTSFEPTFAGVDDDGKMMFMPEHRTEVQFEHLKTIHRAILDYTTDVAHHVNIIGKSDIAIFDYILGFVNKENSLINTQLFESEMLVDEFANRNFNI